MKNLPPLLWISPCGEYRVRILRRCFLRMQRLAAKHSPDEVGTSLAGRYDENGHEAVIASLGPLTPDSVGTQFTFTRGIAGLWDFFESIRRRFRGSRYRVGEWHSHPSAVPIASATDDRNQMELALAVSEKLPEAVLIIVGGDLAKRPSLRVYVYSRERGKIRLHAAAQKQ